MSDRFQRMEGVEGLRGLLALSRESGELAYCTEGLDRDGCNTVYAVLKRLSEQGRTVILCSHDPVIQGAATLLLDLNHKPTPAVVRR